MKLSDRQAEYGASIAVIGKSGRFPGSGNLSQFWQNLRAGKEGISFFTEDELLSAGVDPELLRRPDYVKALGVLEDADLFDAHFFGYTPREAQLIDPQQRVFLECAWEALEDAGYASDDPGMVGVYASSSMSTYMWNLAANPEIVGLSDILQLVSGNDKDYVATRVSYKLNLRGPSMAVQTACSSSLVAIHLACRSLLTYECDLALAGGVSIGVPLKEGYLYEEGGIGSPDGHCRAFDARANGTVMGRGCGVVVLKRLFEAIKAGDAIQAIIRGSAVNNDGSNKVGFTAPSVDAQADVIRAALAVARVPSETITYVEAHGTGTVLGDPIEFAALTKAFRSRTGRKSRCAIGSLKTNIGHLDAAAGVAGLIKTVLSLEHKTLPPSLNFETPNPKAGFDGSPFYVNTSLSEWSTDGTPRRAGVTSLGIGGTNAHVVLEEAPDLDRETSDRKHHLLVLSAKSQAALESLTAEIADHLQVHSDLRLSDVAYSLQVGRRAFPYRRAMVCEGVEEAVERLRQPTGEEVANGRAELRNRPVIFMFPGQGAQYAGMGAGLYRSDPVFRQHADQCMELLRMRSGLDLKQVLYPDKPISEVDALQLAQTRVTQPALFITEYALARVWMHWGIAPEAMIGHSVGEYVAACLAGVMSLEDALAIVAKRGELMQQTQPGTMLAVSCSATQAESFLDQAVSVAAFNTPSSCVVSGDAAKIAALEAVLVKENISCQRLQTSHAFHSAMMDPILDEFGNRMAAIKLEKPKIPYISNLTGSWATDEVATDPRNWAKHLRNTVRFADGIVQLAASAERIFLEVGPGSSLSSFVRLCCRDQPAAVAVSSFTRHKSCDLESRLLLASLGRLWTAGVQVNWKDRYSVAEARRVSLPTYPFERQRYFVEPLRSGEAQPGLLRKKPAIADWFYAPSWKQLVGWKSSSLKQEAPIPWLVFSLGGELESHFVEGLRKANHDVTVVVAGAESSAFERLSTHEFRIDLANLSHYKKLLSLLPGSRNFIHFGNLTRYPDEPLVALQRTFNSMLFLAQTVGETSTAERRNIWIVTNNLADVSRDDRVSPDNALLLGPCRTIPLEYQNLNCALIDVGVPDRNTASALFQCCANPPDSSLVAYRMGRLWSQSAEPLPLPANSEGSRLRHGGVYLITGGLGGIGLTLGLHLARKSKAKLILLDVVPPPPRADWDRLLEMESTTAAVRLQINALRNFEELNAPLLVTQADVCVEAEIRAIVAQAVEKFGAIHGVIHAAGMPGGSIMQFKTPAEIESVLAPKVKGTRVLERIFQDVDLDFFAACSSLTSIQGEFAQVDNCSANAFLDAFCLNNSFKPSTRTVAIGWDAWKDLGMAQKEAPLSDGSALSAVEAVEVFDRILDLDASRSHVLVSTLALNLWSRRTSSAERAPATASIAKPELYSRPALTSTFVAPRNDIERQIAEVWQSVLGVEAIGASDNFWELGGHSLMATQVASRLKERFQIILPLRTLFEIPTIEELGKKIVQLLSEATSSESSEALELRAMPIRRVDRSGKLALSYGQERLWFIQQLDLESAAYNVPAAVRVQGPLELGSMERALGEIVRRQESLRTRFVDVNGEPQQIIASHLLVELPLTDLSHLPQPEREIEAQRLAREEARRPFDLAHGPLFRAKLLRLDGHEHVLVFNMHHIVTDGWSWGILVREISAIYNSFSTGQPYALPELDIQYADFSAWQRELLSGPVMEKQLEYWKRKLVGVEPLTLPTDKPRLTMKGWNGATTYFTLPSELTEGLKHLGRKEGATVYMTMLTAFQALLGRYSRQYDIAVGSPIAGRSRSELEALIGCFINTLVLRTDLSGEPDSIALLQRVKETTLEAYAHQDVPFEKLVEVLVPQRNLTRAPLFQVMFTFQNMPWTELQMGPAKMLPFEVDSQAVPFELSLFLAETDTGMRGWIPYSTDVFETATIDRMIQHYSLLLTGMVSAPHAPIRSLEILSAEERRMLLVDCNATAWSIPETTVTRLFEEQVGRTPHAGAVQCGEDLMSYIQLDQRANQLAHYLQQMGVGPEVLVGICLNRSLDMVVALLGVLKAGGAYVPLDPSYPVERLGFMLEDAQIPVLVTESSLRGVLPVTMAQIVSMDEDWKDISASAVERVEGCVEHSNLAYVIYTSGSTGRPKGVEVTHRGMVNYVNWAGQAYNAEQGSGSPVHSSLAFDLTVTSIYPVLLSGGCLEILPPSAGMEELAQRLESSDYSLLKLTPSHLRMLSLLLEKSEEGKRGARTLVIGGEALKYADLEIWRQAGSRTRLVNEYGPTETVVGSTVHEVQQERQAGDVPVGKPIANTEVYVLGPDLEPQPVGVSGELYIGGAGLARGYVNRPDLTAERFLPTLYGDAGSRMYRTGDLARWRGDGNLEYLGRNDHQVKLRGFRIELGEIEAALLAHEDVRQAVVIARDEMPGDKLLVAYVVPERAGENGDGQISGLREYLLGKLPEHMVPGAYVSLEKLPLTSNGKLDRDSLPAAGMETVEREFVGPRNPLEKTLSRMWQEVLRRERVAIHDNFFTLGGHSLLAVQVAARIRDSFKVDIPIRALFEAPTVAQMAKYIAQVNGGKPEQPSPIVVSIQPQGSRTPFFFVHAVGGQVISYAGLSQELGPEQPFYGLQSPSADLFPDADISIEAMARLYIREIQSVQPRGPYLLGGWSMGGLVAWEMAEQLVKHGETIRLLALIDTTPPSMDQGDEELSMLARFAFDMSQSVGKDPQPLAEQFSQLTPQGQWKMVQEALTNYGILTTETAHAEMTALLDVFTRNANAINHYVPNCSNQPVIYFRAADTPESISRLWTTWACGGVQIHTVPGNHFTILRQPSVRIISDFLQEYVLNAGEELQHIATIAGANA